MKKRLQNLLTLVSLLLVCGLSPAWGQGSVSFDLLSFTAAHPLTFNSDGVTLQFNKSSDISPDSKNRGIRWQQSTDITIIAPTGNHVTEVTFTSNKNGNLSTTQQMPVVISTANADGTKGEYIEDWTTIETKLDTYVWENSSEITNNSINFSFTGSGDIYVSEITVKYEANPAPVVAVTINDAAVTFDNDNAYTDNTEYTEIPVVKYTVDGGAEQTATAEPDGDNYVAIIVVGEVTYTITFTNVNLPQGGGEDDGSVTATFPFTLGTEGQTATFTNPALFKGSYVTIGTNFTGYNLKTLTDADGQGTTVLETGIVSGAKQTSPSDGRDNIDFIINLKKGLKFTPTEISYRATRHGTGGGKIDTYWLNGDGTTSKLDEGKTPERDNGDDGTGLKYTDYSYTIDDASESEGTCGIRLFLYNLDAGKAHGFCDVTIKGVVTGDVIEEVTYTITTNVTPEGAGTVTQTPAGAVQVENTEVTFSATANAGYKFLNKWTVDDTDVEGETYTINSLNADVNVVAQFEKLPVLTFAKPEDVVCINRAFPTDVNTVEAGGTYTLPNNYMYYKEGYTMTGWNDGTNDYACGAEYTVTGDATLTPTFTQNNVSIATRKSEVTVTYDFNQTTNGGRVVNVEANADIFVTAATIDGETIDVTLAIDCNDDAGITGKRGKVNNTSGERAQVNPGSVFTIAAEEGSVITLTSTSTAFSTTTFNGAEGTYDGTTATYTATEAGSVRIVTGEDNMYFSAISVTYPKPEFTLTCDKPTAETGDFTFEHRTQSVTFTAAEGQTLMVAVDDAEAEEMASPATVYPTTKATAYAKAEGYNDSEPVEVTLQSEYDAEKPYVAWVYTSTYPSVANGFAEDKVLGGLKELYNVVLVDYDENTTPSEDLNNADLIVCTESMSGAKTMSNGMKAFVGVTPMISFKMFNYTSGRWDWGTPNNPGKEVIAITPNNTAYDVLKGVTFEADGTTLNLYEDATSELYTENNHIQTVDLTSAPEGVKVMATASDGKTAMFCLNKYFCLGLSSDNWQAYNANAVTVVKNAAAMLIAGTELDKAEETNAISNVNVAADDNAAIYTLSGVRVEKAAKGQLYIKNGKKFIGK